MVTWSGKSDVAPQATCLANFAAALTTAANIVAVDMPIGFPTSSDRQCESLARKLLGPKAASVFPVPCRQALKATSQDEATRINRENLKKGIPAQTFGLFRKMNEVDASIDSSMNERVHEIHPEVSFCIMNDQRPLKHGKKTSEGAALRRELLTRNGFPVDRLQHPSWPKSQVSEDDILDACACAWSAARIARGEHISLPAEPEFDTRGLRMQISA